MPLAYAKETGANFVTPGVLDAVRARTSFVEPHQSFDHQRLWADLLWSPALAFNLFGDLAADRTRADRALHTWWSDVPGTVREVRFAHSPGRLDPAWLGNLVEFDVAFVLDVGDGTEGIVGLMTAYHEVNRRQPPKPQRLPRYREITDKSGFFGPAALDAVNGTELIHIWLRHLLVLCMLQHPSRSWGWGRFVVVHPAGNSDFADACARYRDLLVDESTFSAMTVEELIDEDALPTDTARVLRERYIPG
jgi:PD-(D/E)XK nuclease superfamily